MMVTEFFLCVCMCLFVARQGCDTVHYVNSPQQSLRVTGELATSGRVSWFLLGGIVSEGS